MTAAIFTKSVLDMNGHPWYISATIMRHNAVLLLLALLLSRFDSTRPAIPLRS